MTKTREEIVKVEDLTIGYGDYMVQSDISFSIHKGDVFVIMGGSGCGKTTLMRALVGLLRPTTGKVLYGEESFWDTSTERRREISQRFGVLYQGGALWSSMTLAENIGIALERYTDLSKAEIRDQASFKLSLVGLGGFEDYYPSEISGGMRKRAGLARAMSLDPELLYIDEPSAGLDPISSKRLDDLILELRDSLDSTIVIVTHELPSIFAIGDIAVFLDPESKTMLDLGNPNELRDHSEHEAVRAFLTRGEFKGAA